MPLQLVVDSIDSVPEALRDQYKEANGKFRLDLDGYEDPAGLKTALQKERDNAKAFEKQYKDLSRQFEGFDMEAVKGLLTKAAQDEETKLIAEGKLDEVISKRSERFRADMDKQLKAKDDEINRHLEANKKLSSRALSDAVVRAATKAGALPEALEDIARRARESGWRTNVDGDVVALNGEDPILGKDGKSPLTMEEWAESLRDSASYFFPRAQGTNAPGSGGGATGKTIKREKYDALSPQEQRKAVLVDKLQIVD